MKSLLITLYLSEILYDIRNKAFLTGRSRETADNQAQISWSQLSGDEPEMGQIMRSVESALAVVQTKLAPYLEEITRERILREHHPPRHRRPHPAEPIELPAEDDVLMPSEEHAITLQLLMPDNYNQAFVPALSSSIHNLLWQPCWGSGLSSRTPMRQKPTCNGPRGRAPTSRPVWRSASSQSGADCIRFKSLSIRWVCGDLRFLRSGFIVRSESIFVHFSC